MPVSSGRGHGSAIYCRLRRPSAAFHDGRRVPVRDNPADPRHRPFRQLPLVAAALAATPAERRARVVLRECLIAYAVLLAFMFGGHAFLTLMHVSETALSIAGGVILFLIALRMVFSHPEGVFGDAPGSDPFIVPLAIPAIAGPSALATVMLMASREPEHLGAWAAALTGAMAATAATLVAAD